MSGPDLKRREFVSRCAAGCAGLLLTGCVSVMTHPVPVTSGRVRLQLSAFPELAKVNGAIKVQPEGMADPIYVLAVPNGGFQALSPICTHRGCTVDVHAERLVCPCHGSTYDREGKVLKGPAQRALSRFPITQVDNELVIELGTPS